MIIISCPVTQDQIDKSKTLADPPLKNSIMDGQRNVMAKLAELHYIKMLYNLADDKMEWGSNTSFDSTYNFDILYYGNKIDVKTKQRTAPGTPRSDWDASIWAATKNRQFCDTYAFCQVNSITAKGDDFTTFMFYGHIGKDDYFKKSRFLRKGQIDGSNGYKVADDCYNLLYTELHPLSKKDIERLVEVGYTAHELI
jgi:hypothetical protein